MHKGSTQYRQVPQRALDRRSLYERSTQLETELEQAMKPKTTEDRRYRDEISQTVVDRPQSPARNMKINELIESHSELTDTAASKSAVVLMATRTASRATWPASRFHGWAKGAEAQHPGDQCIQAVAAHRHR